MIKRTLTVAAIATMAATAAMAPAIVADNPAQAACKACNPCAAKACNPCAAKACNPCAAKKSSD